MTPNTASKKTSMDVVHLVDLAEVLTEIHKLTDQVLERVDEKMMLSEVKFGGKILEIEKELREDIADLVKFKKDYREGHMNLINSVDALSRQNAGEHGAIMTTLAELSTGQKEIQRITSSARATIRAEDAWKTYKAETRIGRFISSKFGKFVIVIVGGFLLLSMLHSLGLKQIDPMGWVSRGFESIFPGLISKP
jgi:hypothetical protein